jgi:hypothetical protein
LVDFTHYDGNRDWRRGSRWFLAKTKFEFTDDFVASAKLLKILIKNVLIECELN